MNKKPFPFLAVFLVIVAINTIVQGASRYSLGKTEGLLALATDLFVGLVIWFVIGKAVGFIFRKLFGKKTGKDTGGKGDNDSENKTNQT